MTYGLEEALDLGDGTAGGLRSMSKDTWAIIGAMGMFGATLVSLGAVGINQIGSRIDDLRNDMNSGFGVLDSQFEELDSRFEDLDGDVDNLRSDVRELDDRLRGIEIAFGKVDQRLLTLERAVIPAS